MPTVYHGDSWGFKINVIPSSNKSHSGRETQYSHRSFVTRGKGKAMKVISAIP